MHLPTASLQYALVALLAVAAYWNSLPNGFTFDDAFAVTGNADVVEDGAPLSGLLRHDFWGQEIRSQQSHKSYRPLTVLAFRLTRQAWARVHQQRAPLAPPAPPLGGRGPADAGLSPLPFHALNVALHAWVSALVLALARRLFRRLDRLRPGRQPAGVRGQSQDSQQQKGPEGGEGSSSGGVSAGVDVAANGLRRRTGAARGTAMAAAAGDGAAGGGRAGRALEPPAEPTANAISGGGGGGGGAAAAASSAAPWPQQALLAALAFALHPIHTEAVASIVGQTELLCASLLLPALLTYFALVDGEWRPLKQGSGGGQPPASGGRAAAPSPATGVRQQGRQRPLLLAGARALVLAGACALVLLAALSKETGVTGVAAMAAYDLLLGRPSRRQLARLAALTALGAGYVRLRGWVAGDHLVRIFRKVENPIAFLPTSAARALSTAHLHAMYAWLLLWPARLSADWSYACVPPVEAWADARNAASLALYGALAACVAAAAPWRRAAHLLRAWWRGADDGSAPSAGSPAAWRLAVVAGLLVGPFLPAANVFLYVGTFIGERLLYMPSLGYCLLLGDAAGWLLDSSSGDGRGGDGAAAAAAWGSRVAAWRRVAAALAAALLLGGYGARTALRNRAWASNEALFGAALAACPGSAKVQLNVGILARQAEDWPRAVAHFRRAQDIDPTYCEPTYWRGLTHTNMGQLDEGLALLKTSLTCKYVASDALQALNKLHLALLQGARGTSHRARIMVEWAGVLGSPAVARAGEACQAWEDVALLLAADPGAAAAPLTREVAAALEGCMGALGTQEAGAFPEGSLAAMGMAATDTLLAELPARELLRCVAARRPLYLALAAAGGDSNDLAVVQATYRYVRVVEQAPACRLGRGTSGSSAHQRLLHKVQTARGEDPWLQLEWGRTLAALGRPADAAVHLEVAAVMLRGAGQALAGAPGGGGAAAGSDASAVQGEGREAAMRRMVTGMLSLEAMGAGQVGAVEAVAGAAASLADLSAVLAAAAAQAAPGAGEEQQRLAQQRCTAAVGECQARLSLAGLREGEGPAAKACWQRMLADPACGAHAAAAARQLQL